MDSYHLVALDTDRMDALEDYSRFAELVDDLLCGGAIPGPAPSRAGHPRSAPGPGWACGGEQGEQGEWEGERDLKENERMLREE